MKLLFVGELDPYSRAVNTITNYVRMGTALGHDVAIFGEQQEVPAVPYSLDARGFDYAIFVVYETQDFPDLPYLAQLLDGMPKERRIIIDCCGRYNDTIRLDHDFNHLEKLDGHQGWEWVEGFQAVADEILQPTLAPLRDDVRPFLFHGYDPDAVARPYQSAREAAQAWSSNGSPDGKPYGLIYLGNNWQRWSQIRPFLEAIEPLRDQLGPVALAGWGWDERPAWAVELGLRGVDVEPDLLQRLGVEARWGVPFDQVVDFVGQARFAPVFHRPLFNHLKLVTNRTFETFCADTIPLLMLPPDFVERLYGRDALALVPGDDVAGHLEDMMRRPEVYWEAVLSTRRHLTQRHSYRLRFDELLTILEG
jgi:hypothetical protein